MLTDIDKWNDNENKVTLMTVHSSKGLEFDYIYVVGMEDGLFPILRTFEEEDLEEERRLFYVALTRAQKCVCLSYAQSRRRYGGEPQKSFQSRFLKEIPEHLIDLPLLDSSDNSSKFIRKNNSFNNNSFNNSECNLKLRQVVKHKYFGKGKIEHIQGTGQNAKITILFFNNVRKKLIYKYANLEVIE